jgi:hypothetical protein
MGLAILWSVSAAWFSANRIIAVVGELALYWLCLFAALGGWSLHLANRRAFTGPAHILASPWAGGCSLMGSVNSIVLSAVPLLASEILRYY